MRFSEGYQPKACKPQNPPQGGSGVKPRPAPVVEIRLIDEFGRRGERIAELEKLLSAAVVAVFEAGGSVSHVERLPDAIRALRKPAP